MRSAPHAGEPAVPGASQRLWGPAVTKAASWRRACGASCGSSTGRQILIGWPARRWKAPWVQCARADLSRGRACGGPEARRAIAWCAGPLVRKSPLPHGRCGPSFHAACSTGRRHGCLGRSGRGQSQVVRAVARQGCRKRDRKGALAPDLLTAQPLVGLLGLRSRGSCWRPTGGGLPSRECRSLGRPRVCSKIISTAEVDVRHAALWRLVKSRAKEGLAGTKYPRRACQEAAPMRPSMGSSGGRRRERARARGFPGDMSTEGATGSGIARCERSASEEGLLVPCGLARESGSCRWHDMGRQ